MTPKDKKHAAVCHVCGAAVGGSYIEGRRSMRDQAVTAVIMAFRGTRGLRAIALRAADAILAIPLVNGKAVRS